MALTKNDLALLEGMFAAQDKRIRLDLKDALTQQTQDIKRDIRDEMDARFSASEQKFDNKLNTIREDFAEILSEQLLPSIDRLDKKIDIVHKDLKQDIAGIRVHVGMAM